MDAVYSLRERPQVHGGTEGSDAARIPEEVRDPLPPAHLDYHHYYHHYYCYCNCHYHYDTSTATTT